MSLENEIGLPGEPKASVFEMRKHGLSSFVRWGIGRGHVSRRIGLGSGIKLRNGRCARLHRSLLGQRWNDAYNDEYDAGREVRSRGPKSGRGGAERDIQKKSQFRNLQPVRIELKASRAQLRWQFG